MILSAASHLSGWQCDHEDRRREMPKQLILSCGSAKEDDVKEGRVHEGRELCE